MGRDLETKHQKQGSAASIVIRDNIRSKFTVELCMVDLKHE